MTGRVRTRLVLLDITATHEGRSTMLDIVERVAKTVFIPFTVGGGIKTVDDFKVLLRAGADKNFRKLCGSSQS